MRVSEEPASRCYCREGDHVWGRLLSLLCFTIWDWPPHQAFNEELDAMYNDANLPDDEAWQALSTDLRQTKEDRNHLSRENSWVCLKHDYPRLMTSFRQLKRKLAEVELEKEEWVIAHLSVFICWPFLEMGWFTSNTWTYTLTPIFSNFTS